MSSAINEMQRGPKQFNSEGRYNSAYETYSIDENEMEQRAGIELPGNLAPKTMPVTYTWKHLNVYGGLQSKGKIKEDSDSSNYDREPKVPKSKHILKNLNGVLRPFELVAIMGASGSGKTSLLNTLTFRNTKNLTITGERKLNGVPLTRETLAACSAYVQQDDLFIGTMTVREHLMFQAALRLPSNITKPQRLSTIESILQEFGLFKCAETVIGVPGRVKGISGGEMKRLSLASEVLDDPSIMFIDEPTSGLDSFTSETVISVLKNMVSKGKTIVCTIHQPSSQVYSMFDRILLVADGRTAYLGDCHEALPFFNHVGFQCPANFNPTDFYIQTLAIQPGNEEESRQDVKEICDCYDESDFAAECLENIEAVERNRKGGRRLSMTARSVQGPSWFSQLRTVLWRSWIHQLRDPMLMNVRAGSTIFIAVLFGIIFLQLDLDQEGIGDFNGAMFLFLVNTSFQNTLSVVNAFCTELPIVLRENLSGVYRIDAYFLAKTTAEMPFCIIFPFVFTAISYWMVGFNDKADRFFMACLIYIIIANAGASFGYLISCFSPSVDVATSMVSVVMMPLLLFGGFFLNSGSFPSYLKWVKYISWFYYGNEALVVNQWKGIKDIGCAPDAVSCITNGNQVLENLHFDKDNLIFDVTMLAVLMVSVRVFAFLALLLKTQENSLLEIIQGCFTKSKI